MLVSTTADTVKLSGQFVEHWLGSICTLGGTGVFCLIGLGRGGAGPAVTATGTGGSNWMGELLAEREGEDVNEEEGVGEAAGAEGVGEAVAVEVEVRLGVELLVAVILKEQGLNR